MDIGDGFDAGESIFNFFFSCVLPPLVHSLWVLFPDASTDRTSEKSKTMSYLCNHHSFTVR